MAEIGWWQVVGAALGGGLTVKVLDIVYLEIRSRADRSLTATRFVDEHLDPLLKAADELVGKLHALGREDFRPLRNLDDRASPAGNKDLGGLMYLFARFWAHVEIIRLEGLSVAIAQDERGRHLQSFFDCLESRRVRLIDRTTQRAIGETTLVASGAKLQTAPFIDFVRQSSEDPQTARWLEPLRVILVRGWHTIALVDVIHYYATLKGETPPVGVTFA